MLRAFQHHRWCCIVHHDDKSGKFTLIQSLHLEYRNTFVAHFQTSHAKDLLFYHVGLYRNAPSWSSLLSSLSANDLCKHRSIGTVRMISLSPPSWVSSIFSEPMALVKCFYNNAISLDYRAVKRIGFFYSSSDSSFKILPIYSPCRFLTHVDPSRVLS